MNPTRVMAEIGAVLRAGSGKTVSSMICGNLSLLESQLNSGVS
jgi:hypothetical protein